MNKKIAAIIIGASFVLVTLVLVFYLQARNKAVTVSPESTGIIPTAAVEELATWTDPSEFSFQYPKSLALNPHTEDETNYAHVELTSSSNSGNLIVWVKDTTADTIDAWAAQQKIKNAIDSTLDGVSAKKVLADGTENKITLSTLRSGYLYQIEVDAKDSDFWNKVFGQVVSTFKFSADEKSINSKSSPAASDNSLSGDIESEGEEVIE